jgi:hypothetical protein
MADAVKHQGMQARIKQKHFQGTLGRRITFFDSFDLINKNDIDRHKNDQQMINKAISSPLFFKSTTA